MDNLMGSAPDYLSNRLSSVILVTGMYTTSPLSKVSIQYSAIFCRFASCVRSQAQWALTVDLCSQKWTSHSSKALSIGLGH